MILGILLILASAAAYNSSPVLLAMEARSRAGRGGAALLSSAFRGIAGLSGTALSFVGWVLQLLALTRISVTLAWVLSATGMALLLALSHLLLHEPLGRRQLLGALAIAVGITAVGLIHPTRSETPPGLLRWLVLLGLLTPFVVAPYALRLIRRRGSIVKAMAAGTAYALSGMLTKGLADLMAGSELRTLMAAALAGIGSSPWLGPAALLMLGVTVFAVVGFMDELSALRDGRASSIVPVVAGVQTVIPIVLAPTFFEEHWPPGATDRIVLALGITLTVVGAIILSRGVAIEPNQPPSSGSSASAGTSHAG